MIILGKGTVITRDADRPIMVLLLSTGLKLLILVYMMNYVKRM